MKIRSSFNCVSFVLQDLRLNMGDPLPHVAHQIDRGLLGQSLRHNFGAFFRVGPTNVFRFQLRRVASSLVGSFFADHLIHSRKIENVNYSRPAILGHRKTSMFNAF